MSHDCWFETHDDGILPLGCGGEYEGSRDLTLAVLRNFRFLGTHLGLCSKVD